MTPELTDRTGAPVTIGIQLGDPISSYTVRVADGSPAGRADFIDSAEVEGERIIFHTEVAEEFSGRGLAGLLVREALADCARRHLRVVPVCPLFARHLDEHGEEYLSEGGVFRQPGPADIAAVKRAVRSRA